MFLQAAKGTASQIILLTMAGGGALHFKFDFLTPFGATEHWIRTPEDLTNAEGWNRGFYWHKFTVLRYGSYPSKHLDAVVGTSGTDKAKTDKLISFCHDRRYGFNYFFNWEELKRVRALCYLPDQRELHSRLINVWDWEYRNDARLVLVTSAAEGRGSYLSLSAGEPLWNLPTGGVGGRSRLDELLETFHRWRHNWTGVESKYLQNTKNTKKIVPLVWREPEPSSKELPKWEYIDTSTNKTKSKSDEETFFEKFQDSELS